MAKPVIAIELIQAMIGRGAWDISYHAAGRLVLRNVSVAGLLVALARGEILESYPTDPRGPSALILGPLPDGSPVHAVVATNAAGDRLAIVTVYEPRLPGWLNERTRA